MDLYSQWAKGENIKQSNMLASTDFVNIKNNIERDVEIAKELQNGNKSVRGTESQDQQDDRHL